VTTYAVVLLVALPLVVLAAAVPALRAARVQPMVALRGAMVERYEATPRLHALDGELLPPALIGPLARRADLSDRVDCWMLEAGLDALRLCRATGRSVELFIHRSLGTATDEGWVDRIRDGIAARDLIWLRPVIQLQLQDADRQLELAARRARQLVRLGVRLCLNGLVDKERGARVLDALPVAYVRLGSTVLRNLPLDRLKELVARIQDRGAQVIATGVDGPKAIERTYRARIDLIQGPYVQPPMEAMDFDFLDTEGSR
jgi:EAL domain-containing protein (putative c-di-GMP-specific phosphodiesterase class I)